MKTKTESKKERLDRMFLPEKKTIFIHIPKTAGTYMEKWLLEHSDAELVGGSWRDFKNYFEIKGQYSRHKHMTIEQYRSAMPPELFGDIRIATVTRHPVRRFLSFYFSPHRWMVRKTWVRARNKIGRQLGVTFADKNQHYYLAKPVFEWWRLEECLDLMPSMSSYLLLDEKFKTPNFVLRQEYLKEDCVEFAKFLEIQPPGNISRVNKSAAEDSLVEELAANPKIQNLIREKYAMDYENFGYE